MFKNPMASTMWQFMTAYKLEAVNVDNCFTDNQKKDLLDLMEIVEKNYESIRLGKINKMNIAFHNFDKLFIEYGGNIDVIQLKVDEICNKVDPIIVRAGNAAMKTPKMLQKLRLKVPKNE